MTVLLVAELARRFWAAAGEVEPFPRELRRAIARALPLGIVELPDLRVGRLTSWLDARGVNCPLEGAGDRPLRAALIARRGCGLIFLDGTDPPDERRFSLAHETAHFLADYWWPRRRAERQIGRAALEVLDGWREPTRAERVDAALARLQLRAHVHLMDRAPDGHAASALIEAAESTADALAFELLAPEAEVRPLLEAGRGDPIALLGQRFGLPAGAARSYLQRLQAASASQPLLRRLGLDRAPPASHSGGREGNTERQ